MAKLVSILFVLSISLAVCYGFHMPYGVMMGGPMPPAEPVEPINQAEFAEEYILMLNQRVDSLPFDLHPKGLQVLQKATPDMVTCWAKVSPDPIFFECAAGALHRALEELAGLYRTRQTLLAQGGQPAPPAPAPQVPQ